jgi:hypothetical protein
MMLAIMAGAGDWTAWSCVREFRRAQRASYAADLEEADQASAIVGEKSLTTLSASRVSGSGRLAWLASLLVFDRSAADASIRRDR